METLNSVMVYNIKMDYISPYLFEKVRILGNLIIDQLLGLAHAN